MIRCSIIFSGVVRIGLSGPSVFSSSFRFWVSFLFIAPMSGAMIMYVARYIVAPKIRVSQFGKVNCAVVRYVGMAAIADAVRILVEDLRSTVAL